MPKLKTKSGAKKRFKRTAKGGYKHRSSQRSHMLTKKSTNRKRSLRGTRMVHESDVKSIRRQLNDSVKS